MRSSVLALLPVIAVTCLSATPAFAAGQSVVIDVALGESGAIVGQVVDAQGASGVGQVVLLVQGNQEIARTTTDIQGRFSIGGIRAGVYQLVAGDNGVVVRAWSAGTEPPIAQRSVLLVSAGDVYRGQQAVRSVRNFMAHPVTVVGVVAAGIAVPVAVHHGTKRSPASP